MERGRRPASRPRFRRCVPWGAAATRMQRVIAEVRVQHPSSIFFRAAIAVGVVLVTLLAVWWHRAVARAAGPVIIYVVDALRADRVSVFGAPRDTTPAGRALAMEGVAYESAYAVSTWTRPSVATMLTSRLPAEVGAVNRFGRLAEGVPYLPEMLQAQGWRTFALQSNGNVFDERLGFERGFDQVVPIYGRGSLGPGGLPHARARDVVDPAMKLIQEQRSRRFFLLVHVIDTHVPISLEPEYAKLFLPLPPGASERERMLLEYDRAARQADDQFARLVEALRRKGWWQSALVVYTADHGEELLERGRVGHGWSLYEEQLRVPMIVKYPMGKFAGTRRHDPVSHADLAPTVADVVGLRLLPGQVGRTLAGVPFDRDRTLYFTEDLDDARLYGLKKGASKVIVQLYPSFSRQLFDLERDPAETHGTTVGCGQAEPPAAAELFRALRELRDREVQFLPGVRVEKRDGGPLTIRVAASVVDDPKPFLRDTDLCRFSGNIADGSLRIEKNIGFGEDFELVMGDNDRGDEVALDLEFLRPGGSWRRVATRERGPVRLVRTQARYIKGPTADKKLLEHLRSLGYIH